MKPQTDIDRVVVHAPAKINLCLHVGTRRADGYHDLESLVAFTEFGDELLIERDGALSLTIEGPFSEGLANAHDNLITKAARLLATRTDRRAGARITLTKRIPLASGVGGGSADAAAALRGLVRLWNLPASPGELHDIAVAIGSDVPVCLDSAPAWMAGRGERVHSLPPLPDMSMVLVNPKVEVSTAAVFRELKQRQGTGLSPPSVPFADLSGLIRYLKSTTNDLEPPAKEIAPVIGEVIKEIGRLPAVSIARMSGSGATCFGIVENAESARQCAQILRSRHPDWWVTATPLAPGEFGDVKPG
jgi:4-diphosphocytidyl-2-C-methyl-D-erythritol kinase